MAFQVRDLMASVLPSTSEDGAGCVSCVNLTAYCPSCGCNTCNRGSSHYVINTEHDMSEELSKLQNQLQQQLGALVS